MKRRDAESHKPEAGFQAMKGCLLERRQFGLAARVHLCSFRWPWRRRKFCEPADLRDYAYVGQVCADAVLVTFQAGVVLREVESNTTGADICHNNRLGLDRTIDLHHGSRSLDGIELRRRLTKAFAPMKAGLPKIGNRLRNSSTSIAQNLDLSSQSGRPFIGR